MKTKGALFYLQAEISGNYTTIAAMQSNSMTINQETVEITDKSMLFRELLENAGIGSVSTKAQGIVSNSASYQFIKDSVISGTIINCKLLSNTGEVYSGGFLLHRLNHRANITKPSLLQLRLNHHGLYL